MGRRTAKMTTPGEVRITREGSVACVQMNDAKRQNALGHEMVENLTRIFDELGREEDLRAVVLTGLPEVFSSGASYEVLDDLASGRRSAAEVLLPRILLECPLPCLAAMSGYGLGGGSALEKSPRIWCYWRVKAATA